MIWNGNECANNYSNENLKATVHSTDHDRSKRAAKCGTFQIFLGCMITNDARCTSEIKFRIARANQRSTRRRLFAPANRA